MPSSSSCWFLYSKSFLAILWSFSSHKFWNQFVRLYEKAKLFFMECFFVPFKFFWKACTIDKKNNFKSLITTCIKVTLHLMSLKALCNRISFFHPIILLPITSKYKTISQSGLVFLQIANIHHIPFTHWHPVLCSYYFLLFNPLIFKPVNYKLALAKSVCQRLKNKGVCHLPLQRLNPGLLQLPTFKYRERNSAWKGTLCFREIVEQVFS